MPVPVLQSDVKHFSLTPSTSVWCQTPVWHQMLQSDVEHFSLTPSASVWCQTLEPDTKCFILMSNNSVWHQVLQSDVKQFSLTPSASVWYQTPQSDTKYYSWIQRTSFWCQWKSFSLVPMQQSRAMWQNSPWLKTHRRQNCIAARTENHTFPKLKITHISNTALNISHSTLPLFELSL